jgi:hypothetical protein
VPVTLTEKLDSRKWTTGDNASVEFVYVLTGTSDDVTAKVLIENSTAIYYNGLVRQSIQIEPEWVDETTGEGQWVATVRYGIRPPNEVGESSFAFDTSGGTQHITQSLATIASYAASGTPPNFGGAVGVTHDSVEGVDITIPVYSFSETHFLDAAFVTPAYYGTLFNLTGKVNDAGFKGLAAGECLFLGASGSKRGTEDWEITYRFAGSPNRTGLVVGPMTGINKKGWEYMWVRYADSEDTVAKAIVKKPVAAYIEKVYDEGNFAGLGIGT